MPRFRRPPRARRAPAGFALVELLVALGVIGLAAALAMGAWQRSLEAAALRRAQMQVAAVLRDAILRAQQPSMVTGGQWMEAHVNFTAGSGTVQEFTTGPSINWQWQNVVTVTLPGGVVVASSTFPSCGGSCTYMYATPADTASTGTYESAPGITSPGQVTLQSPHGMTATVTVTRAGTVWY